MGIRAVRSYCNLHNRVEACCEVPPMHRNRCAIQVSFEPSSRHRRAAGSHTLPPVLLSG
jgi:hypothetical protein